LNPLARESQVNIYNPATQHRNLTVDLADFSMKDNQSLLNSKLTMEFHKYLSWAFLS